MTYVFDTVSSSIEESRYIRMYRYRLNTVANKGTRHRKRYMTMHDDTYTIHSDTRRRNAPNTTEKIHLRYMADTLKQVTIHKKHMVSGGIGPIFGGKVALTPLSASFAPASSQARLTSVKWVSLL